ncbi:hypothetical protein SLEP1_g41030 [Rubroshorea leprosula]|uniref:DUF4218 domain-containing protein n=1 Tax=Rubroshorea leprosula TaxID=152421 RepID=A0AAV5L5C4_9ROSI|nr:hypothetical protein SLEP1_g41030 [Rubroshorea leprosula]
MSRKIAEHMTWHLKCCGDTDEVIHPAQSEAWRHFDQMHPSFKREPRNVRLGPATDGFNPWAHSSTSYSCWPVFLIVYNLPPEMCMQPEFTFLTLVIAGPKSLAFFDSMEHLTIHLPYEARVGGPVQFRWMYPFERCIRKLKGTIGNKNHVEASIVEAFILYEISHFCFRYFGDDVETSWNQPPRNYGGIGTNVPGTTINSTDETDYYGVLKEVIELLYYGHSGHQEIIILFNCDWYDTNRGTRVNVEYEIVDVNPRFKLSTGEPFCLASQAQQVYYTPYLATTDRTTRGWLATCKIKSRHLIETSSTSSAGEVDDIFQDDDPSIMQGSSLAIDLTAYQSLQLCAEGFTKVEVDANISEEKEDYGEEKDSKSSGNSDNVEDDDDSDDSDD